MIIDWVLYFNQNIQETQFKKVYQENKKKNDRIKSITNSIPLWCLWHQSPYAYTEPVYGQNNLLQRRNAYGNMGKRSRKNYQKWQI